MTIDLAGPTLTRAERCNPVLQLPACRQLLSLDPTTRGVIRVVLLDLQRDARLRADKSWRKHKAPMAAYWAAVGVYAGHLARVLR